MGHSVYTAKTNHSVQPVGQLHDYDVILLQKPESGCFLVEINWKQFLVLTFCCLFCVFTHVASIYVNLLEQKKAFT